MTIQRSLAVPAVPAAVSLSAAAGTAGSVTAAYSDVEQTSGFYPGTTTKWSDVTP